MPTVMNAANEVLVEAYLNNSIGFYQLSDLVGNAMRKFSNIINPNIETILQTDRETRAYIKSLL